MGKEILINFFFLTYTISQFISYVPQIVKMVRTKEAEDLSLASWGIWLAGSCTYLGYVCLTTPNAGLIVISVLDIACCMTIFFLTLFYQASKRM